MSSREFSRWQAFYNIEPFGDWRADLRIARLAALTANIHRSQNADTSKTSDFMWDYEAMKPQTQEEVEESIDDAFGHFPQIPPPTE